MKINEIARIDRYYRENPGKIKDQNLTAPKNAEQKNRYDPSSYHLERKINKQFADKWRNILSSDLHKKIFDDYDNSLAWWFENGLKKSNGDFQTFVSQFSFRSKDLSPEETQELETNFADLYKGYIALGRRLSGLRSAPALKQQKTATRAGLSARDYQAVMKWIEHFTSMSRKKIPEEIWPALKKLTVNPATLPETVYRGLFYDGAKIKDREKWMKKWAPGSKPKVKPTKVQSWSTSIGVATQFMSDQDFVKDNENGFAVLLKYDITDPSVVIADLRNIPQARFWNQQEIVLSPDARDYEVVAVIPYENYSKMGINWNETQLRKFQDKHSAPGASAWGFNYGETFINNFFDINQMQISSAEKQKMKQLAKATVSQAHDQIDFNRVFFDEIEQSMNNTLLPLYALIRQSYSTLDNNWRISVDTDTSENSKTSVNAFLTTSKPNGFSPSSSVVEEIFKDVEGFDYRDQIVLPVTINLLNADYNNIKFSITPRANFLVADKDEKSSQSQGAAQANQMMKQATVKRQLIKDVKQAVKNSSLNQNKNVSLELK